MSKSKWNWSHLLSFHELLIPTFHQLDLSTEWSNDSDLSNAAFDPGVPQGPTAGTLHFVEYTSFPTPNPRKPAQNQSSGVAASTRSVLHQSATCVRSSLSLAGLKIIQIVEFASRVLVRDSIARVLICTLTVICRETNLSSVCYRDLNSSHGSREKHKGRL